MDDRLRDVPLGVIEVSSDGTIRDLDDRAQELIDVESDPVGQSIGDVFPRSVEDSIPLAFEDRDVTGVEVEEYYPNPDQWLSVTVVPNEVGAIVYLQDVTERRRHQQAVDRLRTESERTALIDDLLTHVLGALVDASSREEITETICATLGESDLYEFAWVGEHNPGDGELNVRAAAGDTGKTLPAVRTEFEEGTTTPEERAVETGESQVIDGIADDPQVPDGVRLAGFSDGIRSAIAIPLVHGSTIFGVVGVYAAGEDAFSRRERTSFRTLGQMTGFAISATRNRNLLLADTVTEVTVEVGTDCVLAALSLALDTSVALEGIVPRGDEPLVCFVSLDTVESGTLEDLADDGDGVDGVRIVDQSGSGVTVQLELRGPGPLPTVSSVGGTVRRATFADGTGQIVVELPPEEDTRQMVDAIRRNSDATIAAKRERERTATTARKVRDDLSEELTDRQEVVLKTAFHADYFESPRESTAEEVAASLDITGSTLLYHLRVAQRKLLRAVFSEES